MYITGVDSTNVVRMAFFHWIPNTSALLPGAQSYYEDPGTFGVRTALNFEGRRDYRTILDRTVSLVGNSSDLTNKFTNTFNRTVNLKGRRIDFNLAQDTGYNHVFIGHFSDSAITPFPNMIYSVRTWYYDTM